MAIKKPSILLEEILSLAQRKGTEQIKDARAIMEDRWWNRGTPLPDEARAPFKSILTWLCEIDSGQFILFAQTVANQILSVINHKDMRRSVTRALNELCRKQIENKDFKAVLIIHLALIDSEAFKQASLPPGACITYYAALTDALTDAGDFRHTELVWQEALEFSKKENGERNSTTASILDFLAISYSARGDYDLALKFIGEAIEIFESMPDYEEDLLDNLLLFAEYAIDGRSIEENFFDSKQVDAVIKRAKDMIETTDREDTTYGARFYSLLSKKSHAELDDERAIETCKRALGIYRRLDQPVSQRRLLFWLARIYADRNEPELVEECYKDALSLASQLDYADEIADNLYLVAGFYTDRQDLLKAEELLEKALELKKKARHHLYTAQDVLEKELASVKKIREERSKQNQRSLPNLMQEIEEMVGLLEVKKALREHGVYMDFLRLRKERGFESEEKPILHAVFTGNPGTGKTTVAKILGQIYHRLGLLSSGHVHTVTRADLVGPSYGAGEKGAKQAITAAKGGVLFIDEAYTLSRHGIYGETDDRDPGQNVIETLLPIMTDPDSDIAIVVAGYPREMEQFLNSNPGLRSRFKLHFQFDDYSPPELLQIANNAAKRNDIVLSEDAQQLLLENFEKCYSQRNKFFGNARYVHSLIADCKRALGLRTMLNTNPNAFSNEQLSLITAADAKNALSTRDSVSYRNPINEKLLERTLAELEAMSGLNSVKEFVRELVKVVRVYRELGKDVLSAFKLHAVFTGNPGTGKTTVARIIASLYRSLGILEKGHLVECDRASLCGQYIGESEQKTKAKIEEALGGVLFIDEAYALVGEGNDFGARAIEILLKEMEDKRGRFFVILAGYKKEMDRLLESNPGLRSRIDRIVNFEDYSASEMEEIALRMLKDHELVVNAEGVEALRQKLGVLVRSKGFANGRTVRAFVEKVVIKHFAALADLPSDKRTAEVLSTIDAKLLEGIELGELAVKRPVGF